MKTQIKWNGSRFAGQQYATLEELYLVLETHPLGDFWRRHGCESIDRATGVVHFWGNFADISHAFGIFTDDPDVIARMRALIAENRRYRLPAVRGNCPCYEAHFARFSEEEADA